MKFMLLSLLILATLHVQISTTYGKTINAKSSSAPPVSEDKSKEVDTAEAKVRRLLDKNSGEFGFKEPDCDE